MGPIPSESILETTLILSAFPESKNVDGSSSGGVQKESQPMVDSPNPRDTVAVFIKAVSKCLELKQPASDCFALKACAVQGLALLKKMFNPF